MEAHPPLRREWLEARLRESLAPPDEIDVLLELGREIRHSRPERALELANRALDRARSLAATDPAQRTRLAAALIGAAYLNRYLNQTPLSVEQSFEALSLLGDAEPSRLAVDAWNNIGWVRARLGDAAGGLESGLKARQLAADLGYARGVGEAEDTLGHACRLTGEHAEAVAHQRRAVEILSKLDDPIELSRTLNNLAFALLHRGDLDEALEIGGRSLEIARREAAGTLASIVSDTLARVHLARGNPDRAAALLEEALRRASDSTPAFVRAYHLIDLGQIRLLQGRRTDAEALVRQAIELGEQYGFKVELMRGCRLLADICEAGGDAAGALEQHRRFHALHEELNGRNAERQLAILKANEAVDAARRMAEEQRRKQQALEAEIEQRRRVQDELRRSEERYRLFFEQNTSGFFISTPEGRLLTCNPAFARLFGFRSVTDALATSTWGLYVAEDDRQEFLELLRHRRILSRHEEVIRKLDGSHGVILGNTVGLFDADGRLVQIIGSMVDITERRAAEQALLESQERLRMLAEASIEGIGLALDGRFVEVNDQLASMVGWDRSDLIGQPILAIVAPEYHEEVLELRRNRRDGVYEHTLVRRDGTTFPAEIRRRVLTGPGQRALVVIRDLTDRRRAEAERLEMERRLLQTQKLESLGVLAGGIAHDFNNLLTVILGHATLAQAAGAGAAGGENHLRRIEEAASRAAGLCRQLLTYAGRAQFSRSAVNLNAVVGDLTELLQASVSKKAALEIRLAPTLPAIAGDPTQLGQVVMNLVLNASEALGDESGRVGLTTGFGDVGSAELERCHVRGDGPPGPHVWLEVRDTGCGIAEDVLARMFEPFFSTRFTGRGLGLSVVQGVLKGHEGSLAVDSRPGHGTTVRVYFPWAPAFDLAPSRPDPKPDAWRGAGRVLLVDDEEAIRALLSEMLEHLGFEVVTAADGQEAVDLFRARSSEFGLVLLDLTMPRMSGEETFHELRRVDPAARIIICSGYSESDVAGRFAGAGVDGFLEKPYTLSQLQRLLREVTAPAPAAG